MKKTKLLFLFILLITLFVSCATLTEEEKHIKKLDHYIKKGYSYEDADILSMSTRERLEYLCPYYDIPVNKSDYNLSDKRYANVIYDFAVGKYDGCYRLTQTDMRAIAGNHGDLASFYTNEYVSDNPDGTVSIGRVNPALSDSELFTRQVKAVRMAQEIHDTVHEEGLITDTMTEYEKCKVYMDWMYTNLGNHQSGPQKEIGQKMLVDGAYSCFTKQNSNCGARGGAFALVMHAEGIKCQTIIIPGHIMNRVLLDGKEYYLDWANSFRNIKTLDEWIEYSKLPVGANRPSTKENIFTPTEATAYYLF